MSYLFYGINSAIKYARDGYTKELSDFLSKKPHLINQKNKNGNTILHIACWKGDMEMVLMLLMRGAMLNSIDSKGYSPLLVAIEFCHDDLALSLLERGADITIGNQALCMPLHVAALSGCKNIVIPLLHRGADINAIETNGCTPLLCALRSKNSDVALILIDKGADLSARDRDDWLPLGLAKLNGMTAVTAAIALRYEYQNLARERSASVVSSQKEAIIEKYEKSRDARQELLSRQSSLPTEPHLPPGEIIVLRSRSQPALMHTMSPTGGGASVTSTGGASKTSKGERKQRKERRASSSGMSTSATTAAIEAVTLAMQESGGDISKAAQLLIRQQQAATKERRKLRRADGSADECSLGVSVISEGTTLSKGAHKKKSAASSSTYIGNPNMSNRDDDRSTNSVGSKSKTKILIGGCNSRIDESSVRSGSRRDSARGGALGPIEEELVIRREARGSHKKGVISAHEESFTDDVDSDGEKAMPPALFCFWVKSAKQKQPLISQKLPVRIDADVASKPKGGCILM